MEEMVSTLYLETKEKRNFVLIKITKENREGTSFEIKILGQCCALLCLSINKAMMKNLLFQVKELMFYDKAHGNIFEGIEYNNKYGWES